MKKLELKHLAPYLPYGLKILCDYGSNELLIQTLTGCHSDDTIFDNDGEDFELSEIKPILRPLSDLEKDEYNFIYENETDYDSTKDWINMDAESRLTSKYSYEFWQELFHYHFDVFGLIEQGLAIDINTL